MTARTICQFEIPGRPISWKRSGQRHGQKDVFDEQKKIKEGIARLAYNAMKGPAVAKGVPVYMEMVCVYDIPTSWKLGKQSAAHQGVVFHTGRPDQDNLQKLVMDALSGVVYADDAQIAKSSFVKRFGKPARTIVRFTELPDWKETMT